jgi:hypothetical protein
VATTQRSKHSSIAGFAVFKIFQGLANFGSKLVNTINKVTQSPLFNFALPFVSKLSPGLGRILQDISQNGIQNIINQFIQKFLGQGNGLLSGGVLNTLGGLFGQTQGTSGLASALSGMTPPTDPMEQSNLANMVAKLHAQRLS